MSCPMAEPNGGWGLWVLSCSMAENIGLGPSGCCPWSLSCPMAEPIGLCLLVLSFLGALCPVALPVGLGCRAALPGPCLSPRQSL